MDTLTPNWHEPAASLVERTFVHQPLREGFATAIRSGRSGTLERMIVSFGDHLLGRRSGAADGGRRFAGTGIRLGNGAGRTCKRHARRMTLRSSLAALCAS